MTELILKPLKGFNAFEKAIKSGKKISFGLASGVFCYSKFENTGVKDNNTQKRIIYFGVTVSKRIVKSAVIRNRIKRLLRVCVKELVTEFNYDDNPFPYDTIILFWRAAPAHARLLRLSETLHYSRIVFRKAMDYYKKNLLNV